MFLVQRDELFSDVAPIGVDAGHVQRNLACQDRVCCQQASSQQYFKLAELSVVRS